MLSYPAEWLLDIYQGRTGPRRFIPKPYEPRIETGNGPVLRQMDIGALILAVTWIGAWGWILWHVGR